MTTRHGRGADSPTDIPARGWGQLTRRLATEIRDDKVSVIAAGLAFYAMLAVFPALIAFVSIYGIVANPDTVTSQVSNLAESLSPEAGSVITSQLQQIVETSSTTLSWAAAASILGALWTASSGSQQLIRAVDTAYDEEETRSFVKLRGVAIVLTLVFFVLAAIAVVAIVVVPRWVSGLGAAAWVGWLIDIARFLVLGLLLMAVLAVVYRYGPDRRDPAWRWVTPGAVAATVLWLIGSVLFGWYVQNFGSFGATYGALAGVIVLMLWFFISGFVVLMGAELNSELEYQTGRDRNVGLGEVTEPTEAVGSRSVAPRR